MKEQIIKILESYIVDNIGETSPRIDIDTIPSIADEILSLQLQQTGVIASCSNAYIGKEFVYTSRITNCKTIFKVARTDDRYGQTILISENKNRYFLSDVIPHN